MTYLGIDAGSSFTKYCVMDEYAKILALLKSQTRVKSDKSGGKIEALREKYDIASVVSCGYGRNNVETDKTISELIALAKGLKYTVPTIRAALDIGGQDTKVIRIENGRLKQFYINDKCAAGCGIFLLNTLRMLDMSIEEVELFCEESLVLSSTCAVFAQTEIINLIAEGETKESIINSVVHTILKQGYSLLQTSEIGGSIALTGGFTNINNIDGMFSDKFGVSVIIPENGDYLSAIGCALYAIENMR